MASIQRIQDYLVQEESASEASTRLMRAEKMHVPVRDNTTSVEKHEFQPVFCIENGTIGWIDSSPLLRNVSFHIQQSQITLLLGQ